MKRDLHLLAGAVFLSAAGDFLALITLALVVHELTGDGFAVAAFFATTLVPAVLLAPVAGAIADRFESVRVLKVASLAQAAVAVGLAFGHTELGALLALSALLAAGSAISAPAEFALVPALTDEEGLTRANGLMETARYAGYTVGPLLAALLAAFAGTEAILLVNAASFLAIAGAAALMHTRRHPVTAPQHAAPDRASDGVAALLADRELRATLLAAVGALLFVTVTITAEVFYAKDVLDAGDSGYALITAAWMIGMVGGALKLAARVPAQALATMALVALGVQGAGIAAQTAWAILPFAIAGYFVGGLGHGVKNTLIRSLIAQRVPERMHGRAFAAYNAARNTAELAALGAGGALVAGLGARTALALAGMAPILAATAGLLALRRPALESGSDPLPEVT